MTTDPAPPTGWDSARFRKDLNRRRIKTGASIRMIAEQSGVPSSTVARVLDTGWANLPTLVAMCRWAGVSTSDYVTEEVVR